MVKMSDIENAAQTIEGYIHKTPVLSSSSINQMFGCTIRFKCENFQKVGAFKARGACNAVFSLPAEVAAKGFATHSSGNHGAALAYAAAAKGVDVHVVMPQNAPRVKRIAVESYGAKVVECGTNQGDRQNTLDAVVADTGAHFVSSADDNLVIAGQGTMAVEFYDQTNSEEIDILLCPVGGGGLLGGCAIASKHLSPKTRVIAAEPLGANDAAIGFSCGERVTDFAPHTIADGLRTAVGVRNFAIMREYVDEIVTVKEESIIEAMRIVWERMKIIIEPSSAVPLGAVIEGRSNFEGKKIGIILSGGNVDLGQLPWINLDGRPT
jgi:threonine dehydratase